MNHMQQRHVFERAGHRDVVVESFEGPFENLDRRRTLKTLVYRFEFVEEVSGRRNQGHLLNSLTFLECFTRIYGDLTDYDDDTLAHLQIGRASCRERV